MAEPNDRRVRYVSVPTDTPVWEKFPMLAPLVLVGTIEMDGEPNIAPKHLAMPVSWDNLFGFVCHPNHGTYRNAVAQGSFTVSFPTSEMILHTSLAAAPRASDGSKPTVQALPLKPSKVVDGVLVDGCRLQLECELDRVVEDLGENVMVIGKVVAVHVAEQMLRDFDVDDSDLIHNSPLLAYVHPGRVANVANTVSFPFHQGFSR